MAVLASDVIVRACLWPPVGRGTGQPQQPGARCIGEAGALLCTSRYICGSLVHALHGFLATSPLSCVLTCTGHCQPAVLRVPRLCRRVHHIPRAHSIWQSGFCHHVGRADSPGRCSSDLQCHLGSDLDLSYLVAGVSWPMSCMRTRSVLHHVGDTGSLPKRPLRTCGWGERK